MHASPRSAARSSYAQAGTLTRPEYEGAFGVLLLALILVSTLDAAAAPLLRGFVLVSFGLLTIANAGAAFGVYLGMASLFSVHHFAGQGSWVQRPDNFAFLILFAYLALGRAFGRHSGAYGWSAGAAIGLVVVSIAHLILLVGMSSYELSWFVRAIVMPLALFVVLRRAGLSPKEMRAMFLVLGVVGLYHAVITLLEFAKLYDWLVPSWLADPDFNPAYGLDRIGGIPMQPEWNALDISLALAILLLRGQLSGSRQRAGLTVVALLCLVAIYLTYTRASWLGLMAGGAALYWQARPGQGSNRQRRMLFLAGAGAFIALVLFFPSDILRARTGDSATMYFRLSIWIASLDMMFHNLLWGVGFGQFASHLSPFLREVAWIPARDMAQEGTLAHNTFLSVAAEFGLVGLILYLVILIGAYRGALKAAGQSWGLQGQSWVTAFVLVYVVNVQFITAHKLTSNMLFYGVIGAIAGMQPWRRSAARPAAALPDAPAPANELVRG